MIVTVTPAPAIDWTITVEDFQLGAVNRVTTSHREPSGKGVNISWALHRAGIPTRAVLPAGGPTGAFMAEQFDRAGLAHVIVDTGRDVRTNVTLITRGESTKINEPGTPLSATQLRALGAAINEAARDATAVVICGSLPRGVPATFARDITAALREAGVDVILDTSGEPLELALPARPKLIKPNISELAGLVHRPIRTFGDVVRAAHEARERGAEAVLASLASDGAIYVDGHVTLFAKASEVPFVNSVGAGDALLAGFLASRSQPADRLATATLWAASAVAHASTRFPIRQALADHISVGPVPAEDRPLAEPSDTPGQPARGVFAGSPPAFVPGGEHNV